MSDAKARLDGWANILTGIGTKSDKAGWNIPQWQRTDRYIGETLYSSDDLAGKIASIIPEDGCREGIEWVLPNGEDPDLVKHLNDEFDRLSLWENINWAWTLSRVYGGSIIYISVDDGREIFEPLDWKNIKRINSLNVFDRWQLSITSSDIISDIRDPSFGLPAFYNFMSGNSPSPETPPMRIHYSRVIRFDGIKLPTRLYIKNDYWHDSVYGKLYRSIRNYSSSFDSIANIMQDFNQPVFKVHGLAEALAMDNDNIVSKKIESVNLSRSVARAVILDKEDDFANVGASVSGLSDLVKLTVGRVVAGSGIPHTRLLGESPSGLGATGNSELTDYYDMIKAQQELRIRAPINYVLSVIFAADKKEMDSGLTFKFKTLYQVDQNTVISTRKVQADIDSIYIDKGVYTPEMVLNSRFGSGEYSFETSIDDDLLPETAGELEPIPEE